MSRIFDALQRSEGERSGDDPVLEGPELLRRAEERIASKRDGAASVGVEQAEKGANGHQPSGLPEVTHSGAPQLHIPTAGEARAVEERLALLSRVQSIRVVASPESRLVTITDPESPTAESFRLLGVRIRDLRRIRPLKKVLITSTIPREGKSTIAANLACAIAHASDEKILLIEGDVRLPALRQMFGVGSVPGLCELIQEGLKLADCVYHLDGPGIWILPSGRSPENPLEILQSPRLPQIMDQLAACFDWIILDSPPVLPLADTSIWMRLADGILLVTRQGVTEKQQLTSGLEALEPGKVLGALLNSAVGSIYSSYYYRRPGEA